MSLPMETGLTELIDAREAAAILGKKRDAFYKWHQEHRDELPEAMQAGKNRLWRRSDVEAFRDSRK